MVWCSKSYVDKLEISTDCTLFLTSGPNWFWGGYFGWSSKNTFLVVLGTRGS